jgi:hypothetical protein
MDAVKKQGHFKAYEEAQALYIEQRNLAKQAKAALAELDGATSKGAGNSKKSSKKPRKVQLQLTHLTPNCKLCTN